MNCITKIALSLLMISFLGMTSCKKDKNKSGGLFSGGTAVGVSANDLLSDSKFKDLRVEIQYVAGFKPTDAAMDNLKDFLTERLNKNSINFVYTQIASPGKAKYSVDDIKNIEKSNRTVFNKDSNLGAYFLFLDGEFVENSGSSKVLGIAYTNTSMVIFEETVKDLSGGIGEPATYKLESAVALHEFGHILGLVNAGTPLKSNHQDVAHGHHCDNENCLMYWTVETGDFVSNLVGTAPIPSLDSNCLQDLKANGGK